MYLTYLQVPCAGREPGICCPGAREASPQHTRWERAGVEGSIGVAGWTQGLKVPPRPPTQLLAVGPQDPAPCWKGLVEAQPAPVCLPPPGLAPLPRQPPLPGGPGERISCQSSDLRAESGGRRGAEPGPLKAGDSEVLKSWTQLVLAGGGHCTQWTLLTALGPQPHQGGGLYAEPAGCQMCNAPCPSQPSHLYPEVSFIAHGGVWGSI